MPISSLSRVVEQKDPILENDLELLAKVNTYEQSKFDAGASALQNEVNNWALMSQIAKPELRDYANQKLNKLVSGINSLGGVNLSDINNVNQLKSLGYNIYADKRITDGVVTTQKMKALQADSQAKLSGKDAGKYDNAISDYLMKGYSDWASDGNVNNTRYDGPTSLPEGNMNTINKKVQDYLKELKPDSDSTPSGDMQKSYGYFQVDGKWLKGNRIEEAINAVTDENDSLIFRAHGWKALGSNNDKTLIGKLGVVYDNASSSIKKQINYLKGELNQSTDAGRKLELSNLISQQKQALATNDNEKNQWFNKEQLSPQERDGIQQSLYQNAWKSNVVNSYSYSQEAKKYTANQPLEFHDRMQMEANHWAADYNLKVADFGLKEQELDLKREALGLKYSGGFNLNGQGLPMTQRPNTSTTNEEKNPAGFIDNINSKYFALNSGYYQQLYNIMGSNDTSGRFDNVNGAWKPKPQYKNQIDSEVSAISSKLDNYSNLTDDEKKNLNLPVGDDELQKLFNYRNQINTYGAYQKMADDKETEIIHNAIATGLIKNDFRQTPITIDGKTMTTQEALALYKAGVYTDATKIEKYNNQPISVSTKPKKDAVNSFIDKLMGSSPNKEVSIENLKDLKESVDKVRSDAQKSYEKSGELFNSYEIPMPFQTQSKPFKEIVQKQLGDLVKLGKASESSINILKGYVEMNFQTGEPEFKVDVEYGTTDKDRGRQVGVDVTKIITDNPYAGGLAVYFPKSNMNLVWGLHLSENGATPFSKQDNYKSSLRTQSGNYPFQISNVTNTLNGTAGLKAKIALPVGDGTTVEVNVKNLQAGDNNYVFPANLGIEGIQQYLDELLSTPEGKKMFYEAHGLKLSK